jgi:hypothetical protein
MHTPEDLLPIKTRPASTRNPELSYTFHHHPSPGPNSSQGRRTMSGRALCPTPSERGKLGSCLSGARSYRPDLASYTMLYMPTTHEPLWSKREEGGLVRAATLHGRERYSSFTSRLAASNRVIIIDPQWNKTAEQQAFGRGEGIYQARGIFYIRNRPGIVQIISIKTTATTATTATAATPCTAARLYKRQCFLLLLTYGRFPDASEV